MYFYIESKFAQQQADKAYLEYIINFLVIITKNKKDF